MPDRKKILIIDDEEEFCKIVKMGLEVLGSFSVEMATSGHAGLKMTKKLKPAAVLLDIGLPDMDGIDVLKQLKSEEGTMAIPVIMVTAKEDDQHKKQASESYNEMYITKPVKMQELKEKIDAVLKTRGL